jgi:DNA-binding beta-propeller fold protein YncE
VPFDGGAKAEALDFEIEVPMRSQTRRSLAWGLGLAAAGLAALAFSEGSPSGYRILQKISLPGAGRGDYLVVDEASRRLYVSHTSQVEVLDVDSRKAIGTIPNTPGVHGIAIASDLDRGFTTNGQSGMVTVFAAKALKPLNEVKAGAKPDAIVFEPVTSRVFAFNGGDSTATAISAADAKSVGTIDLGGAPEFAVADGQGFVFDNLEDKNVVVRINARTLAIEQRWPTAPCEAPSSMAIDRKNRRLFIGCRSRVMAVLDADSGKVVATAPIGDHVDATAYDPSSQLVFNSNGEGSITVIHQEGPDRYSVIDTIKTVSGAKTMALDPRTHQLFLSVVEDGKFEVLVVGK